MIRSIAQPCISLHCSVSFHKKNAVPVAMGVCGLGRFMV